MKSLTYILILMTLLSSCKCNNSQAPKEPDVVRFDKIKWQQKDDQGYTYRDKMAGDLITSKTLDGLKRADVLNLLGNPDRNEQNYLFYELLEEKAYGFSLNKKVMLVYIGADSVVENVSVLD